MTNIIIDKELISIPKEEQETVLNHGSGFKGWSIYTCEQKMITKLLKIFDEDEFKRIVKNKNNTIIELDLEDVPDAHVLIRPVPKKKELSDEQRQVLSERMKEMHKKK